MDKIRVFQAMYPSSLYRVAAVLLVVLATCMATAMSSASLAANGGVVLKECSDDIHRNIFRCDRSCYVASMFSAQLKNGRSAPDTCLRIADTDRYAISDYISQDCENGACIIKIICRGNLCIGSGYVIGFINTLAGYQITIKDRKGRITELYRCATCFKTEYQSGPLRSATVFMAAGVGELRFAVGEE